MESCWLCPEKFTNLTSLNRHLASKKHTRLRVICPWCLGQERTFTRVADLKIHCGSLHPESLEMDPRFFTSSNAFFLSRHPDDYRRIVTVGQCDSEEAIRARKLVETWCRTLPSPDIKLMHWKAGWLGAMEEGFKKRKHEDTAPSDIGEDPDIEIGASTPSPKGKIRKVILQKKDRDELKEADKKRESEKEMERGKKPEEEMERRKESEITEKKGCTQKEKTPVEDSSSDSEEEELDYNASEEEETTNKQENLTKDIVKDKERRIIKEIKEIKSKIAANQEKNLERTGNSLMDRATNILKVGAMPLCPPGRREWLKEETLEIELSGKILQWPPKDFQEMSPDQKLLAWEYAAMSIEHQVRGEFPRLSRPLLLDTYNFLALPGTRKSSDCQAKACRKARFYNYQMVKEVAKGNLKSDEGQDLVAALETIQSSVKRTYAARIASQLDEINVPLRIGDDL